MILPTKYIKENEAIIGIGGVVLHLIRKDIFLSELWDITRSKLDFITFERFVLTLDFLFMLGLIDFQNGQIQRRVL